MCTKMTTIEKTKILCNKCGRLTRSLGWNVGFPASVADAGLAPDLPCGFCWEPAAAQLPCTRACDLLLTLIVLSCHNTVHDNHYYKRMQYSMRSKCTTETAIGKTSITGHLEHLFLFSNWKWKLFSCQHFRSNISVRKWETKSQCKTTREVWRHWHLILLCE